MAIRKSERKRSAKHRKMAAKMAVAESWRNMKAGLCNVKI
jgi:hypothetical protein